MRSTRSADGTTIAFERSGEGPPVILIGAALQGAATYTPLAEELAQHYTAVNYDRRGRGASGDHSDYAIEREVEDVAALIEAVGGPAAVYGHSSGAGLALHAAAQGLPISHLVLHEPPYGPDREEERRAARAIGVELQSLLTDGRRQEALETFLAGAGMPEDFLRQMSADPAMQAMAHTIGYDLEIVGNLSTGGTVPRQVAADVSVPTLVLNGGDSPDWMSGAGLELTAALQQAEHQELEGYGHFVPPEALAPVIVRFLGDARPGA